MLLHVTHETRYDYAPPVETAQHLAHLKPRETPSQRLVSHALSITPAPAQQNESPDLYGNTRAFFALESTHEELVVTAESVVETSTPVLAASIARELPWEEVRERFRYRKGSRFDAASDFVFPSRYVPRHDDFATYARPSFAPGRPTFDVATDLMQRMYRDFDYDAGSTEISTPAVEALAQRKGVCQDFAHILIACFRTMGLPARYVSGYLYTTAEHAASHAWVDVWLKDHGWISIDVTNRQYASEQHCRLAVARDYDSASPVRGVRTGGGHESMAVHVHVQQQ